jgi:hypothetical protein
VIWMLHKFVEFLQEILDTRKLHPQSEDHEKQWITTFPLLTLGCERSV